jgi:hypothetical protein
MSYSTYVCGGCGKEYKNHRLFAIHRSRCAKKWKQNHPTPDKVIKHSIADKETKENKN